MKTEIAIYGKGALDEPDDYFNMYVSLTEEELLSLVSSLTNMMFEDKAHGLFYEVPRHTEIEGRTVKTAGKPKSFAGKGQLTFRMKQKETG